ncbi:MAG TPA: WG repeat-containing protein, partial [Desulfuromonadaceae bacterium]
REFAANGLAAVRDDDTNMWGYIDETGDYVIEPQFGDAGNFAANGLAAVQDAESQLYGYIDKTGDYVIEPQFYKARDFVKVN